jgi:leucine efflux protein
MMNLAQSLGVADPLQLVAATMVFLMLPGPGTFCILSCAAQRGLRGGYAALAGVMLGDSALMLLASLGVAALLRTNPLWFNAVRYAGAVYLCWMGLRLLLARGEPGSAVVPFKHLADLRRGLFITLLNPKAIVFYMAFFPLFIDPATQKGSVTLFAISGIVLCCTLCYGSFLVLVGNAAASRLKNNRTVTRLFSRTAGVFLIGFGIKITTN